MAGNRATFGYLVLEVRESLSSVELNIDLQGSFHFSIVDREEEKLLLLGLCSRPRGIRAFLLGSEIDLTVAWKPTSGLRYFLSDCTEEIPSIEEFSGDGTLREFLGAVLSKRARYRPGARAA